MSSQITAILSQLQCVNLVLLSSYWVGIIDADYLTKELSVAIRKFLGPLLLTWINFNPNMDK